MASDLRLTAPSYIVLGLLDVAGESTPYDLKTMVAGSIERFWSIQHTQLYSEPERLAAAGFLSERREEEGRRRRFYSLTAKGRQAYEDWLKAADSLFELRDMGLLKIYFGADPQPLAEARLPIHERQLAELEARLERLGATMTRGGRLALEAGLGHELEWVRFWSELASGAD